MVHSTVYRQGVWPEEEAILRKYLKEPSKKVVEAGAGGGRLTFFIESLGFGEISGFDIVSEMVALAQAEALKRKSKIKFEIGDAADLNIFDSNSFDYLVYIQQVLCFVPKSLFNASLSEAYRIAKKDAIVIFSFLDYESRFYNPLLSLITNAIRTIRGEDRSKYHLPWLKINDTQINWRLFKKGAPSVYWVKKEQILNQLKQVGFEIMEVDHGNKIHRKGNKGALYVVCRK